MASILRNTIVIGESENNMSKSSVESSNMNKSSLIKVVWAFEKYNKSFQESSSSTGSYSYSNFLSKV